MTSREKKREEERRLLAILFQALAEPIGLFVNSNSPVKARQRLYSVRAAHVKASGNDSLKVLRFMLSPRRPNELVILRADAALPESRVLPESWLEEPAPPALPKDL